MSNPKRLDEPAAIEALVELLQQRGSTSRHPQLHQAFARKLAAAGCRQLGGAFVLPCGTPAGAWIDEDADAKAALAKAERQVAKLSVATAPAAGADVLSPAEAAERRRQRDRALTDRLVDANLRAFREMSNANR